MSPPVAALSSAFCTFLTTVRNFERSDVLAALRTTSWRARLRPDARRTVFFLAFEEVAMLLLILKLWLNLWLKLWMKLWLKLLRLIRMEPTSIASRVISGKAACPGFL